MTQTTPDKSLNEPVQDTPPAKRFWKHWKLLVGAAVIVAGTSWATIQLTRTSPIPEVAPTTTVAVSTLTIHPRSLANTLSLSGTIQPIEQATLSTRVNGRIMSLPLEAGDHIQKGQVVATINTLDIAAQTNQARSGVTQAQAELARSQATLSQLTSQRSEAQAALRLAQINQKRMTQLRSEGAIAQAQLDEANTRFEEATARVAQADAGIRQATAAIAQSRAAIGQAQSNVAAGSVNESYGTVIAPFDGAVVQKLAYEGEMAAPGTALLKVENLDRLQLEISVPEENLHLVRVGQSVQVRVDAIDKTVNAVIQQIIPASDPNSRSFLVKIPLTNPGNLISGMFGRIELPQGWKQGITIPTNALIHRGQLEGVYVVESKPQAQSIAVLRWIKTGKQQNGQVEIVSGLMPGDRMITSNISQLSDGQAVYFDR